MKIAVCVKWVPESPHLDEGSLRLDRSGDGSLNQFDANAVEEALRLREDGGEVVVVSMGPPRAVESLRRALAMGADRAVLVADQAAVGSDLVATSRVLAAAIAREDPQVVLFGQQSSDSDGAVLGAAVAERLRRPVITQVAELSLADGSVRAKRQTEFGYDVIEAALPVVLSVSDAVNEPRHPSLKGIMAAKSKPQEILSLAEIGVDPGAAGEAGSKTEVRSVAAVAPRTGGRRIDGEGDAAVEIVEFLAEKRVL